MMRRTPSYTRTDTHFPCTTLFRSLVQQAISVEDRFPHRIEQEKSDGIAKQCAQNRRQCTYEGIITGALRFGQAHGTQQHIGWDGEKAAFRKADTEKPARRVMVGRLFKRPVVKASQHRRWR